MVCIRSAWLVLGSSTMLLEDVTKGYFCQSLDIGYPAVREVVSNRPDMNGVDDRTQYMGSRVITADIMALTGAGAQIDAVAVAFGPFMNPAARPVLHYVLDRPGHPERQITVRGADFGWPLVGGNQRGIHLGFVAAEPIMRDPNMQTSTAWAGTGSPGGRTYNLTFARQYPAGGSSPTRAEIHPGGDVGVRPTFRIYGPITSPAVAWTTYTSGPSVSGYVRMVAGYQVAANHWLDLDSAQKTAYVDGDHTQPAMASIDWQNTAWPLFGPAPDYGAFGLQGTSTSTTTQVQATWRDGYLT